MSVTLWGLAASVAIFGSLNNVFVKVRSKPFGAVDFYLTLLNDIVDLVVYGGIFLIRYWLGYVNFESIKFLFRSREEGNWWQRIGPFKYLVITGGLDALAVALGFITQPHVSGVAIPILSQSSVLFTIISGYIFINKRYTAVQVFSVILAFSGAIVLLIPTIAAASSKKSSSADSSNASEELFYSVILCLSNAPSAISFTFKEMIFDDYKKFVAEEKEKALAAAAENQENLPLDKIGSSTTVSSSAATLHSELDVFALNSISVIFGLCFFPLMIPINFLLTTSDCGSVGGCLRDFASCLTGTTPDWIRQTTNCDPWGCCSPALWSYVVYITINLLYNISILLFLRMGSAVFTFIVIKLVTPISVFLYLFKIWPLLQPGDATVTIWALPTLVMVLTGLYLFYRSTNFKASLIKEHYTDSYGVSEEPDCWYPIKKTKLKRIQALKAKQQLESESAASE